MNRAAQLALVCLVFSADSARAYRTARDLPELSGRLSPGQLVRWPQPVFEYHLDLEALRSISFGSFQSAVETALRPWRAASCSGLEFRYRGGDGSPASGDRRNGIGFVSGRWGELGFPTDALAISDVVYADTARGWEIVEADIWLNAWDHRWTAFEASGEARSVQATVTHEIGHALGILHPCEVDGEPRCSEEHADSSMHPLYGNHTLSLSDDDTAALCLLYPSGTAPCSPGCGPTEVCVDGECRSACGDCPAGMVCESAGRCVTDPSCGEGCLPAEVGDRCELDGGCRSGACRDGRCVARCGPGDPCLAGTECRSGTCVGEAGGFGDHCTVGEECASGVCLDDGGDGYCTRPCAGACPASSACQPVSGTPVCVLPSSVSSCSAMADRTAPPITWLLLFVSLLAGRCSRRKAR